jgi:hypothetical protein
MFIAIIGREDALAVHRPDIVRWTNHLVELGNSTNTINDGKLAALKVIFRWGIENEVLSANPATGVSVERSRKSGQKMVGFEKEEAATILRAPPHSGVGPQSATMRQVAAEGRDHCLWFFATRKVAAYWRLPGHSELCLPLAPRWVTFAHADATLDRTGLLDN